MAHCQCPCCPGRGEPSTRAQAGWCRFPRTNITRLIGARPLPGCLTAAVAQRARANKARRWQPCTMVRHEPTGDSVTPATLFCGRSFVLRSTPEMRVCTACPHARQLSIVLVRAQYHRHPLRGCCWCTGQHTGAKGIHTCTQLAARRWRSHLVWWTRMTEQQEAVHQQQQKHNRKRNRNTTGYVPRTQRPRMASMTNSETKSHEIIPTPRAVPTPSNVPNHAYQRGRY